MILSQQAKETVTPANGPQKHAWLSLRWLPGCPLLRGRLTTASQMLFARLLSLLILISPQALDYAQCTAGTGEIRIQGFTGEIWVQGQVL
jgi:hypothetical protein